MTNPTYFTVVADFKSVVVDLDTDVDPDPQLGPVTAKVTFTPVLNNGDVILATNASPRPTVFVPAPIVARIDTDGQLKLRVAPDGDRDNFANLAAFPATGNTAKVYFAIDTQKFYRWIPGSSQYVEDYSYAQVRLLADTALLELESPLYYKVSFSDVVYNGGPGYINSFTFQAPTSDTELNLAEVLRQPGQPAVGITKIAPGAVRAEDGNLIFSFNGVDIPEPIPYTDVNVTMSATDITDSTPTGRSLITAINTAAAKAAIKFRVVTPEDFGAAGDGSDDSTAIIALLAYATANAGTSIYMAAGKTYGIASTAFVIPSFTHVWGGGTLKCLQNTPGGRGIIVIPAVGGHDIIWDGPTIDGNFTTNANCIGAGLNAFPDVLEYANLAAFPATGNTAKVYLAQDTQKFYRWTPASSSYVEDLIYPPYHENIYINCTVKNARAAAQSLPGGLTFGGGGKGYSIQGRCRNIYARITAINCDIGATIEAGTSRKRWMPNCQLDMISDGSRRTPLYVFGSTPLGYGTTVSASFEHGHMPGTKINLIAYGGNTESFVDFTDGNAVKPNHEVFGVITSTMAVGVEINAHVAVQSKATLLRGKMFGSKVNITAYMDNLQDVWDARVITGEGTIGTHLMDNVLDVDVHAQTHHGVLITPPVTGEIRRSNIEVDTWIQNGVGNIVPAGGDDFGVSVAYRFRDLKASPVKEIVGNSATNPAPTWALAASGGRVAVQRESFPYLGFDESPIILGTGGAQQRWLHWDNTNTVLRLASSSPSAITTGYALSACLWAAATDGDTTPTVKNRSVITTDNSNPTTITALTNGLPGQIVTIRFGDANTTIAHGSLLRLAGGVSKTFNPADTVTFCMNSPTGWTEVARTNTTTNQLLNLAYNEDPIVLGNASTARRWLHWDNTNTVLRLASSAPTAIDSGTALSTWAYTTPTSGDTTPSVKNRSVMTTNNSTATTITELTNGIPGQIVTIRFGDANTAIAHSGTLRLRGAVNKTFNQADTVTFCMTPTGWTEVSRTDTTVGMVKGDVGLGNVDNTSNATERAATATLTNKDLTSVTNTFPTFNQNSTGTAANVTGTVAIANGGTGSTSLVTAATASSVAARDANANITADNFIGTATSTATAAGTTTMTIDSTQTQVFTGSTTQTVLLPTTDVVAGQRYRFINSSSGSVTIQSSGANTITTLAAGASADLTANVATPTTAANWRATTWPSSSATLITTGNSLSSLATSTSNSIGVGNIELGNASDTTISRVSAGQISVEGNPVAIKVSVPSTATSTGVLGQWAADSSWLYICTASNTWRRVAIASW
jgi:hypothetical protein